jgi:hypothetical protein
VIGYSQLMEQNDTMAIWPVWLQEMLEPLVARQQGRVFKIAGDGASVRRLAAPWNWVVSHLRSGGRRFRLLLCSHLVFGRAGK